MAVPQAERQAAYRTAHPEYTERERRRDKARRMALATLKERHSKEYEVLYHNYLEELGVDRRYA